MFLVFTQFKTVLAVTDRFLIRDNTNLGTFCFLTQLVICHSCATSSVIVQPIAAITIAVVGSFDVFALLGTFVHASHAFVYIFAFRTIPLKTWMTFTDVTSRNINAFVSAIVCVDMTLVDIHAQGPFIDVTVLADTMVSTLSVDARLVFIRITIMRLRILAFINVNIAVGCRPAFFTNTPVHRVTPHFVAMAVTLIFAVFTPMELVTFFAVNTILLQLVTGKAIALKRTDFVGTHEGTTVD